MNSSTADQPITILPAPRRPRLGFVGVGWIGRNRLEAIAQSGLSDIAAIVDSDAERAAAARVLAPAAQCFESVDHLWEMDVDGIVIATPNAFHEAQAIAALEHGMAVFCQKPLARTADQTTRIVDIARACDRLLCVDLSYRFLAGVEKMREIIRSGSCGPIFAAELVFHNAYGPDKPWFYDLRVSGGGCLLDLGVHLVDLALWCLDFPKITQVTSSMFAKGQRLKPPICELEDFATAQLTLESGASVQIGCSWNINAGCDAIISGTFYGTRGGLEFRNVDGSFTDFAASHFQGTKRKCLDTPPDHWQGRAAVDWVRQLARSSSFNPEAQHLVTVARTLDQIYNR